jgi:membrane associated rhomboid family serine protease
MKHTIQQELGGILSLVGVIWLCYLINLALPFDLNEWGLAPRTFNGLSGIVTMPLLHGSFRHLTGNTVPLIVLLCLLAGSRAQSRQTVAMIWLLGGAALWVFGRNAMHIGASGLVNGLIAFLIVAGLLERRFQSLVVAVIVGFLYGGSLLAGMLPTAGSEISWDGHLAGALAGGGLAWVELKRQPPNAL